MKQQKRQGISPQENKSKSNNKRNYKKNNHKRNKDINVPSTVQETISYRRILPDGICQIDRRKFSKTVQFYDINYLLAQNEDKSLIFESYCEFLNYFDSSISIQLTFLNQTGKGEEMVDNIQIEEQDDEFNDVRKEYSDMLKEQLAKGNNGLSKTKYITFAIEADNIRLAKPRLERIESDIINNFKAMGVSAFSLNGKERLELLYEILNHDTNTKMSFNWNLVKEGGMSTKDFISPSSLNFSDQRMLKIGNMYGAASFLQILAPELSDSMLAEFLNMENDILINFHIQSLDQSEAIKNIKHKSIRQIQPT